MRFAGFILPVIFTSFCENQLAMTNIIKFKFELEHYSDLTLSNFVAN